MRISLYFDAFQIVKLFSGRNERLYALPQLREDCNQPNIVRDGLIYSSFVHLINKQMLLVICQSNLYSKNTIHRLINDVHV